MKPIPKLKLLALALGLVLVTTLGGIDLIGLSGIVVGPLAGALFITGWELLTEQRLGTSDPPRNPDARHD